MFLFLGYSREIENSVRFTPAVPKYKNWSLGQYRLEFSSEENLSWESRESDADLSPKTSGECQKVLQCVPNNSCVVRKCSAVLITAQNTLQSSHRADSIFDHFFPLSANRVLSFRLALKCCTLRETQRASWPRAPESTGRENVRRVLLR